jgi:hypothetical protein
MTAKVIELTANGPFERNVDTHSKEAALSFARRRKTANGPFEQKVDSHFKESALIFGRRRP